MYPALAIFSCFKRSPLIPELTLHLFFGTENGQFGIKYPKIRQTVAICLILKGTGRFFPAVYVGKKEQDKHEIDKK